MKIALCLHGLFNSKFDSTSNGYDGYKHIEKHILNKGNVDVYIHSWEIEKQEEIYELYNPKKAIFEPQKDFTELIENRGLNQLQHTPRPPQNILSHLYSVTEAIKLAYTDKYDIIIKARFDLGRINRNTSGPGLGNPYPVQCINFQTNIEPNKIYLANWNHFHMGPADMWFYGDQETMKYFTHLYDDLESNFIIDSDYHQFATNIENNRGDLSNSIAFYKYWMMKNNLWDNKICLDTTWE
jgi:hypothetical protein